MAMTRRIKLTSDPAEAERLAVDPEFLTRGVNVEFSGGEKKRMETLQCAR